MSVSTLDAWARAFVEAAGEKNVDERYTNRKLYKAVHLFSAVRFAKCLKGGAHKLASAIEKDVSSIAFVSIMGFLSRRLVKDSSVVPSVTELRRHELSLVLAFAR